MMRICALLATVVLVNGQAGTVRNSQGDLKVTPPDGGTTVFVESGGSETSIKTILAQLAGTDVKLENLKTFVEGKVTEDLAAAELKTDEKFEDVDAKLAAAEDQVNAAIAEMGRTSTATRTAAQQYTNQKVADYVTPAIKSVENQMKALETKINGDVGKKLSAVQVTVESIMKSLKGSSAVMAAESCSDIATSNGGIANVADGMYWIKSKYQGTKVAVYCKKISNNFVSMGGDGSSKAAAAADCEGPGGIADNDADKKWIDPDANANDPSNAVNKVCSYMTCKEIKDKTKTTTSGKYAIKPKGWTKEPFEVWCDMKRDGGGWTLTEMHTNGWNNNPRGRMMPDNGANVDKLLSDGDNFDRYRDQNNGDYASMGSEKIMAIYHSYGGDTILRSWTKGKYFNNHGTPVNFYYQKKKPTSDWNIMHAIRNTKLWSGSTHSSRAWSSANDGFKMTYKDPAFDSDSSVYDPVRNVIKNQRGNRGYMYYWEEHTIHGNSGKSYRVSRHGIPGDPFGGCQWNFYFWGGDGQRSHIHCDRGRKAFYWLR